MKTMEGTGNREQGTLTASLIRRFFWMVCFGCCSLFPVPCSLAEIVDRIVAVVNEEIITQRELEQKAYPILLSLPTAPSEADVAQIRRNVLIELIKNRLVVQAAKEKKILLDRQEVESFVQSRLEGLRDRYGSDLESVLSEQGFTFEEFVDLLRREAKQELIKSRLIAQAVESMVVVTDDDIRTVYHTRILVARTNDEALRALLLLKSGKLTFPDAVRQFSTGPNVEGGGDMGEYLLGRWSEELEAEVIKLRSMGDLTGVIPTQAGFAVVQLMDRHWKPIDAIPKEDRDKIRGRLRTLKSVSESTAYVSALWDKAYIKFID